MWQGLTAHELAMDGRQTMGETHVPPPVRAIVRAAAEIGKAMK